MNPTLRRLLAIYALACMLAAVAGQQRRMLWREFVSGATVLWRDR